MSLAKCRSAAFNLDYRSHAARYDLERREARHWRRLAEIGPTVKLPGIHGEARNWKRLSDTRRPPRALQVRASLPSLRAPLVDSSCSNSRCSTPGLKNLRGHSVSACGGADIVGLTSPSFHCESSQLPPINAMASRLCDQETAEGFRSAADILQWLGGVNQGLAEVQEDGLIQCLAEAQQDGLPENVSDLAANVNGDEPGISNRSRSPKVAHRFPVADLRSLVKCQRSTRAVPKSSEAAELASARADLNGKTAGSSESGKLAPSSKQDNQSNSVQHQHAEESGVSLSSESDAPRPACLAHASTAVDSVQHQHAEESGVSLSNESGAPRPACLDHASTAVDVPIEQSWPASPGRCTRVSFAEAQDERLYDESLGDSTTELSPALLAVLANAQASSQRSLSLSDVSSAGSAGLLPAREQTMAVIDALAAQPLPISVADAIAEAYRQALSEAFPQSGGIGREKPLLPPSIKAENEFEARPRSGCLGREENSVASVGVLAAPATAKRVEVIAAPQVAEHSPRKPLPTTSKTVVEILDASSEEEQDGVLELLEASLAESEALLRSVSCASYGEDFEDYDDGEVEEDLESAISIEVDEDVHDESSQ